MATELGESFEWATAVSTTSQVQHVANSDLNKSLTGISAALSILGTLAIIFTYILWEDVRTSSRKILVYISIADFFTALGNLLGLLVPTKNLNVADDFCIIQSFMTTCSSMWSFFWTAFLAVFLFVSVAKRRPDISEKMMPVFFFFGWLLPLVITTVAASLDVLGIDKDNESAGWCWISSDIAPFNYRLLWMLITGKAWEIAAYILITMFYALLKCHLKREVKDRYSEFSATGRLEIAQRAERKMIFIPIVFILLRIWGTVRFFLTVFSKRDIAWLVYLQGVGDSGQGFANFMLFCFFTEKFQRRVKILGHKICCCCQACPINLTKEKSNTISTSEQQQPVINESTHLIGTPSNGLESSMKIHPSEMAASGS